MDEPRSCGGDTSALVSEDVLREFTPHPYVALDRHSKVVAVNDAWLDLLGRDRDDVRGERFGQFLMSDASDRFDAYFQAVRSGTSPADVELPVTHADGYPIPCTIACRVERDEDGKTVRAHCQLHDVSSYTGDAERLQQYETLIKDMDEGVFVLDDTLRVTFIDETAAGPYPPERWIGKSLGDLSEFGFDDRTIAAYQRAATDILDGDNTQTTHSFTTAVPTDDSVTLEVRFNGVRASYPPNQHRDDVTSIVGVVRDISDRKEYEDRLRDQRDNLAVLNQMLRHDIRNDLQVLAGQTQLLDEHLEADDPERERVESMQQSIDKTTTLIEMAGEMANAMLTSDDDLGPIDLGPVLATKLDEAEMMFPNATFEVNGVLSDIHVEANELLGSVFENLLQNAVQHNDADAPTVRVSVRQEPGSVTVLIADDGPGVPAGSRDSIFDEGESTSGKPHGGIGLFLVETLVTTFKGDVEVRENEMGGATFAIDFPTIDA